MPPSTVAKKKQSLAKWLTVSIFFIMLIGQFTLDRIGQVNPLPLPERSAAVILVLLVFTHPLIVLVRKEGLKPWTTGFKPLNVLFGVLLLSALWSLPSDGLSDTVWDILTMAACCLGLELALRLSRETVIEVFMSLSAVVGLIFAIAGLVSVGSVARIAAFGGGPNVFARVTGMGVVATMYFVMRQRHPRYIIAGIPLMLVATLLSGSRGALAGTIAALFILSLTLRKRIWKRLFLSLAALTPFLFLLYGRFGSFIQDTIQIRIVRLTFQEQYTSGRTNLMADAWQMFLDKPFAGWGLHGFEALHGIGTGIAYPHNFVIQTAAETGIVGLTALGVLVFATLVRLTHLPLRDPSVAAPIASVALMTVASLFSGDYYDSRFLWAYLLIGLSWAASSSDTSGMSEHEDVKSDEVESEEVGALKPQSLSTRPHLRV